MVRRKNHGALAGEIFGRRRPCTNLFEMLKVAGQQPPMALKQIVFEVGLQEDGTWTAAGIGDEIFTQGTDIEDLKVNTVEAIRAHFYDEDCDKFEVHFAQVMSQFFFAA